MPTTFQVVRDLIRSALLDNDLEALLYSDSALDGQIVFHVSLTDDPIYALNSASTAFAGELTNLQKALIAIKIAIYILSSQPESFSYRSPVLSVSRTGHNRNLLARLETLKDEIEGGVFAIAIDTDFDALVQSLDRYLAAYDQATRPYRATS
jgi:hypothetical protein